MSEIEKLIQELCPEGVPFKKLNDMCHINRGVRVVRSELAESGKYEVFQNSLTPLGYYDKSNSPSNTTFVISAGAAGQIGFSKKPFWAADDCLLIRTSDFIENKYVYYCLLNKQQNIISQVRKASVPRLSRKVIEQFEIPVPPLEVQQRIVEILDNFTSLTAELEAELEARKRQYEYYRNLLLTFNPVANGAVTGGEQQIGDGFTPPIKSLNIRYLSLGEMGTFIRGKYLQKRDFVDSGYPCIHYGQLYTYYGTSADKTISFVSQEVAEKSSIASKNDLLITLTSENEDDVCKPLAWLGEEDIAVSGHMVIYKHNQNPKYLSYLLQSEQFFIDKRKIAHGTKVIEVKPDNLAKIVVPIPPLDEQERIVAILDSFETLVNDLTAGLPAEIEARRKQYEYYRNKLLTFKKIA